MKFLSFLSVMSLLTSSAWAQSSIIPRPVAVTMLEGGASALSAESGAFLCSNQVQDVATVQFVVEQLRKGTGLSLPLTIQSDADANQSSAEAACICFTPSPDLLPRGEEAYRLRCSGGTLDVFYASPKALLRAYASIVQLLSLRYHSAEKPSVWTLGDGAFDLIDAPRYAWRALLLDEARHFYGEAALKDLLDQMLLLKMNVLHWHLTDNDGWRIEIKKYPRLTEVGGKRADTEAFTWKSGKSAGVAHEGFYTQDQVKSIVAYAAERGITIIPEFDVPGHSTAAAVAYPWLSLKSLEKMPVTFGSNLALDPTKESTYEFVSDVFDELITLFPSPVLHFGGDEVRFAAQWKDEPAIVAFMEQHGYKSLSEVQLHFTKRVQQIIRSKGRRSMGWNEIMGGDIHGDGGGGHDVKGEVLSDTIIHYWDGPIKLVEEAVLSGHDVVNSANPFTYMDFEYGRTSLEKSYRFNPTPPQLSEEDAKRVLGMGVQVWTEWMPSLADMQCMLYPRFVALAEVAWSPQELRDYSNFLQRLQLYTQRLDAMGVKYHVKAAKGEDIPKKPKVK